MPTSVEPHERFGDAIHIRLDDKPSNERPIVLMGHRDTVFPKGEVARRPFRIEGGRAYGPGVVDMKGGLVLNAFVLAAFKRFGGAPAPLAGLITSDEEIASPSSRPVIERVGRQARCVFNSEPGRPSGNVVTSRKGGVFLGHGGDGQGGPLRRQLREGHQRHRRAGAQDRRHAQADRPQARHHRQCRPRQGRAVRQHHGAPMPRARSTCATSSRSSAARRWRRCRRIVDTATVPGTTAKLEIKGEFLPVSATPAAEELFGGYQAAAADAGLKVAGEFTGRLRGLRLHLGGRLPDACAASGRSGPMRTRPRSTWRSRPWCRAPRPWRSPSCACLRQGG